MVNSEIQTMKTCLRCVTLKSLNSFSRNRRKKDGLEPYCKTCCSLAGAKHYASNKEKRMQQNVIWRKNNPYKSAAYCKKWRESNPEKAVQSDATWYKANRDKKLAADKLRREENLNIFLERERASYLRNTATALAKNKKWRDANPDRIAAHAAARRAALLQRTPAWLTESQWNEIFKIYLHAAELSKMTGVAHHVDHEIPLRGKCVSGLHVPWNLQVLTAKDNLKKNNQYTQ